MISNMHIFKNAARAKLINVLAGEIRMIVTRDRPTTITREYQTDRTVMKIVNKILLMLPLLGLLAGCASTGNQGGTAPDVGTANGADYGPVPGNALDNFNTGGGLSQKP